ncbi:MAG TPA: serine/threonine-protein kinase [Gemmataceae bacterium]|nr:serine/threonine-protein kinase [Gemmataceae bacterium]
MDEIDTERQLDEALAAYLEADSAGWAPERERLLRAYPHLADKLGRYFAGADAIDRITAELRDETPCDILPGADVATLPRRPEGGAPRGSLSPVPGYEMLGGLGRGGMGVVYKARQVKANRLVALKMILSGGHAAEGERARFRFEAEAIARLNHPNVVQVFEVGEHDGLPFFSLEFCPGGTLEQKLAGTPMLAREAASLVAGLARAVQAAHEQGLVHRDLKPANVLLAANGTPKVTDFGLVKNLRAETHTVGAIIGTPSYMAPEQAASGKAVGPAADTYALGAILFECLTGRPPFKAATHFDTLMQVIGDLPLPPGQLQPKLPRDLETICLKCLEKEPHKRYASAAALADDLGRFLRGEPVLARPVGRLARGWRWCRRNRGVAGLVSLLLIVLLAGTAVSTYFAVRAERAAGAALAALTESEEAKQRQRTTALRLARWLRKNPGLMRLPSKQIIDEFLLANPDLDVEDLNELAVNRPNPFDTSANHQDFSMAQGTEAGAVGSGTLLGD